MSVRKDLFKKSIIEMRDSSRDVGYDTVTITVQRGSKEIAKYIFHARDWDAFQQDAKVFRFTVHILKEKK